MPACGLALAASLFLVASCRQPVSHDVAATVNGRPVTYQELDRAIAAQYPNAPLKSSDDQTIQLRLEVLRTLIDSEILLQRAEKQGLLASDSEVDAKFNELKAPYTQEDFHRLLTQRKMNVNELKAQIRRDLSVQKLFNKEIGSQISISDADVTAFYNANKASFNFLKIVFTWPGYLVTPKPDSNVRNLKNDKAQTDEQARSKMDMLRMRLGQGEDFGALAQNYSEDPDNAANGGDVGFVPQSSLDKADPELRKLIESMTPGQISPMIRTAEGYQIIKLLSKEPAGQRELSDPRVQENIRQMLFQRKDQMLRSAFYEVARSEAKVRNYYAESVLESRASK